MNEIPTLRVSLNDSGIVELFRLRHVPDMLWSQVVAWWSDGRVIPKDNDSFLVPVNEFAIRMSWLRFGWTTYEYEIEITDSLKALLKSARDARERFLQLADGRGLSQSVDLGGIGLVRPLTEAQSTNINRLVVMDNGANFSVPGAGKTSTELVVWRYLRSMGDVGKLLVISPRSAFEAWLTEPDLCFSDSVVSQVLDDNPILPMTEILIVNYEQLEREDKRQRVSKWVQENRSMVVLDEAHRVKGGGASVRWRACQDVIAMACRVDLLTGTPMPQGFDDLRNLLSLSWSRIPGSFFTDARLQSLSRGGAFVRTTKRELDLPELKIYEEMIKPGPIQEQIYAALCRVYFGTFQLSSNDASYLGRKGRAVMTLLAAATNPGLLMGLSSEDSYLRLHWPPRDVRSSAHLLSVIKSYASHEMPMKYEWIRRFVEIAANDGRKVLVWSTFVGNLHALRKVLEPFSPAMVYGATSTINRTSEIERFRHDSECSVLLTNPQTLGEGISLHRTCHDAIYVDRSYNAGLYLQSLDRIHRLGLLPGEVTNIYLLGTEGTIDQRVSVRLRAKVDRLAQALDDNGLVRVSMPDDELELDRDEILGLDSLDLDDLFSHLERNE